MFEDSKDPNAAREKFKQEGFDEIAPVVGAVDIKRHQLTEFSAEFLIKGSDVIYHFFRNTQTPWPSMFRDVLWEAMEENFHLQERRDKLDIEWVGELYSWCVTIKDVAVVVAPSDSMLEAALHKVEEMVSVRRRTP